MNPRIEAPERSLPIDPRRKKDRFRWPLLVALAVAAAWGCGSDTGGDEAGVPTDPGVVMGETREVFGGRVSVWARLADDGSVETVGMTLPLAAVENAPSARDGLAKVKHGASTADDLGAGHDVGHGTGDGPAGAVATLSFPDVVRDHTLFDHLELHWNERGHAPDGIYAIPHYDLHFFTVPEEEVLAVDCGESPSPPPDRIPPGYVLPPGCEPEMGQHAFDPLSPEYAQIDPKFTETFLIGFWNGELTFLEPMITKEFLLGRGDFGREIPVPAALGRATTYPTRFVATWNAAADAYEMTFTEFVAVR